MCAIGFKYNPSKSGGEYCALQFISTWIDYEDSGILIEDTKLAELGTYYPSSTSDNGSTFCTVPDRNDPHWRIQYCRSL